jgi:hypothetical protein
MKVYYLLALFPVIAISYRNNLYLQKGKLPNNFKATLPHKLATHALDAFKDEYLLNFININPEDDERVFGTGNS